MKRSYSERTIKLLFGRATGCAYPDCQNPLVFEDRGKLSVIAQIAHIRSESGNGPRFDPTFPEELIDQESNLILLCGVHHKPVDDHASVYPVEELLDWKRNQVALAPGATLTELQMFEIIQHYDLNSLEPMGFEKLCQALAVSALGPGTKIHGGYGPDGGRDASFCGRLESFPSENDPWDGYVVMQAGFVHAGANTPAGARRLRDWIKHQVTRWAPSHRPETAGKPADYLILATNVSVSAAFGFDGHDEIDGLIRGLSNDTLRGWQIWDEVRIFDLLDTHADVRLAFAPLMTSSRSVANFMDSHRE